MDELNDLLEKHRHRSTAERVALYNAITAASAKTLLHDLPRDPCLAPQLVPVDDLRANDYNPNRVADPELNLLQQSIEADGITMPVVASKAADHYEVTDGFHRRLVSSERIGRKYIPCSIIDSPRGGRMASTVRHNRARGKHQVDLQGALVVAMCKLGIPDADVASQLGMSQEELLRMKQIVGAAKLIAGTEYSATYGRTDEPPDMLGE